MPCLSPKHICTERCPSFSSQKVGRVARVYSHGTVSTAPDSAQVITVAGDLKQNSGHFEKNEVLRCPSYI